MDRNQQAALAAESKAGNKEAFGMLYEHFIRPIYNFIYYKTHHKETAEDLASKTFIKAYQSLHMFNDDRGPFSAWLYQIARNLVIDHYRAQKPLLNVEDVWDLSSSEDIESDTDTKLKLEKIKVYLQDLSSEQRDIVIMRIWQEMSYSEIATALGKSEASCKMSFSRSMRKLREIIPEEILIMLLLFTVITRKLL